MNILNFFKFLEDKEGRALPPNTEFLDPNYVFNIQDFIDENGDVVLSGTPITFTQLPDNLVVKGNLYLNDCKRLQSLPNNLVVKGDLILSSARITSLPKDLRVDGGVDLIYTPIADKYTEEEIKQMCPGIKGEVYIYD